ncbi:hypothetical protein NHX12_024794, partial [Muraenolepis orangiensis]
MQTLETDPSPGPEPRGEDCKPGWGGPEAGNRSEILDWIKLRKKHLKFRGTVLMKRQQLRTSLSGVREEEEQIHELAAIYREFEDLTTRQRELGCSEGTRGMSLCGREPTGNDDLLWKREADNQDIKEHIVH